MQRFAKNSRVDLQISKLHESAKFASSFDFVCFNGNSQCGQVRLVIHKHVFYFYETTFNESHSTDIANFENSRMVIH